jgi:RNA polymerase sigma-70 factor (ECF subfamily)
MSESAATPLAEHRSYLMLLARMQLSPALQAKVDLSGVVQQTLWEAAQTGLPKSSETSEVCADGLAWLRRLLANNLRDEIRKQTAARRDVRRESSLETALEASSARVAAWLHSEQSSPSQRAVRSEDLRRLAEALSALPDDQRQAIEWHHLQGRPLAEVAHELGRTKEAVAALLYRALKRLRERLEE